MECDSLKTDIDNICHRGCKSAKLKISKWNDYAFIHKGSIELIYYYSAILPEFLCMIMLRIEIQLKHNSSIVWFV